MLLNACHRHGRTQSTCKMIMNTLTLIFIQNERKFTDSWSNISQQIACFKAFLKASQNKNFIQYRVLKVLCLILLLQVGSCAYISDACFCTRKHTANALYNVIWSAPTSKDLYRYLQSSGEAKFTCKT